MLTMGRLWEQQSELKSPILYSRESRIPTLIYEEIKVINKNCEQRKLKAIQTQEGRWDIEGVLLFITNIYSAHR